MTEWGGEVGPEAEAPIEVSRLAGASEARPEGEAPIEVLRLARGDTGGGGVEGPCSVRKGAGGGGVLTVAREEAPVKGTYDGDGGSPKGT